MLIVGVYIGFSWVKLHPAAKNNTERSESEPKQETRLQAWLHN